MDWYVNKNEILSLNNSIRCSTKIQGKIERTSYNKVTIKCTIKNTINYITIVHETDILQVSLNTLLAWRLFNLSNIVDTEILEPKRKSICKS